jgi:hypothetical protein
MSNPEDREKRWKNLQRAKKVKIKKPKHAKLKEDDTVNNKYFKQSIYEVVEETFYEENIKN